MLTYVPPGSRWCWSLLGAEGTSVTFILVASWFSECRLNFEMTGFILKLTHFCTNSIDVIIPTFTGSVRGINFPLNNFAKRSLICHILGYCRCITYNTTSFKKNTWVHTRRLEKALLCIMICICSAPA